MVPELRLARKDDIPAILRLEARCFPDPWSRDIFEECVRPSVEVQTWLALDGGRIIGYSCGAVPVRGILHISNLCVERRWRRHGAGRFLLDAVEAWGRRMGARHAYLEVAVTNRPALSLYAGRGYLPCEPLEDYYGEGFHGVRLLRSMSPSGDEALRASLAEEISARIGSAPPVGVVTGSGLGWILDSFPTAPPIPYDSLPGAASGSLPGHEGMLAASECGRFVFLSGRRHRYQGFDGDQIPLLPSVLADLGTRAWVLTCSAGAVSTDLEVGDAVVISDHINLSGCVPGMVSRCGGAVYSGRLRRVAMDSAEKTGPGVREGIFASVSGPAYETALELSELARMGASAVSMSTVQEALALSGLGCDVLGLALISNDCAPGVPVTHQEVLDAQSRIRERRGGFLELLLERIADDELR